MNVRGFTLIELLIVVAIIAILAAIAVPNFLEAQTRSKVSRVKSDMRSVATALESYAVDHNKYPPAIQFVPAGGGNFTVIEPVTNSMMGFVPYRLTTPVAYISGLPIDIFESADDMMHPKHVSFHYSDQDTNATLPPPHPMMIKMHAKKFGVDNGDALRYMMYSNGPDLIHQDHTPMHGDPVAYDPTNGTISWGDIYYFGPGVGLR